MTKYCIHPGDIAMKWKHIPVMIFSGCLWLFIGVMLLTKGVGYVVMAAQPSSPGLLLSMLAKLAGDLQQAALTLITIALFAGFFKGRFVLAKSARRVIDRLVQIPEPVPITKIYNVKYIMIIGSMVLLGIGCRWLNFPLDIRGGIDITIGSALVNGSLVYFRSVFAVSKQRSQG